MARGKKGGVNRLSGLLNAVPRDAQADVRATLIDRLGRAKGPAQSAEGDVFSPSTFLTNWTKMSSQGKNALFGQNTRMRNDLNDIALLSESARDVAKFGNAPGTGRAGELLTLGGIAATAATTFNPVAIAALAALPALGAASARLLASPRFVRLLARAGNVNTPAAQRAFMTGLKGLAVREPALAGPVAELSNSLTPRQTPQQETPKEPDLSLYEKYSDAELQAMADQDLYEGMSDAELEALAKGSEPTLTPGPDLQ
jgi:hypothetical protein